MPVAAPWTGDLATEPRLLAHQQSGSMGALFTASMGVHKSMSFRAITGKTCITPVLLIMGAAFRLKKRDSSDVNKHLRLTRGSGCGASARYEYQVARRAQL